ncbi:MAG TPA: hypothetical protein VFR31_05330 [Thermoanaerobaculia bacterium]|nr:hypothetical protein [Thermoanaerobaculia bacterium]
MGHRRATPLLLGLLLFCRTLALAQEAPAAAAVPKERTGGLAFDSNAGLIDCALPYSSPVLDEFCFPLITVDVPVVSEPDWATYFWNPDIATGTGETTWGGYVTYPEVTALPPPSHQSEYGLYMPDMLNYRGSGKSGPQLTSGTQYTINTQGQLSGPEHLPGYAGNTSSVLKMLDTLYKIIQEQQKVLANMSERLRRLEGTPAGTVP